MMPLREVCDYDADTDQPLAHEFQAGHADDDPVRYCIHCGLVVPA